MATVTGVLETALHVGDVERSRRFYQELFGFEVLVNDPRLCALSVAGRQVLLLFHKGGTFEPVVTPGGTIPGHGGSGELHVAFSVPTEELEAWKNRLAQKRIAIESTVQWPLGGWSVYFRDPDRHLVELVTPGCWSIY